MICEDVVRLLGPFQDGELPAATRDDVAGHLETCVACRRRYSELAEVSLKVRAAAQSPLPEGLRQRVRDALAARTRADGGALRARLPAVAASLASAAAGAALAAVALGVVPSTVDGDRSDPWRDPVAAHVRTLVVERGGSISSGDPHAVRPWFAGRLDFAPPTPDLSAEGFPLTGARLDYVGGRIVAAVTYRRRQHQISVFVWPQAAGKEDASLRSTARQGYNLVRWTSGGLVFTAVSDLNAAELDRFRTLLQPPAPRIP